MCNQNRWLSPFFAGLFLMPFFCQPVQSQMQADGTLGTLVNGSQADICNGVCAIEGGTTRGANLFHSFRQFSLPITTDFAGFLVDTGIQNVIVRVTGVGQPFVSNINSTIAIFDANTITLRPANFFLLNPNGIVFGPGAQILVGGSFLASSADRVLFPEGEFRVDDPAPLLTVSTPIGLGFGRPPGEIRLQRVTFANGSTPPLNRDSFIDFALIGGNVTWESGGMIAPDSHIEIGGMLSGRVGLSLRGDRLQLAFSSTGLRGDVTLRNRAPNENLFITVVGEGLGSIAFNARNLRISGEGDDSRPFHTLISAGIDSGLGAVGRQAGNITFNATESVVIDKTLIGNSVSSGANGSSGNIEITAKSLTLANESRLNVTASGTGNAGNVLLQAQDDVLLSSSNIASNLGNRLNVAAVGKPGNIQIEGQNISLTNESQLQATIFPGAQGLEASLVSIQAQNAVSFSNGSGILATVGTGAIGNGSNIRVRAHDLSMDGFSALSSSSTGQGNAGNIDITVNERLSLHHSLIDSSIGLDETTFVSQTQGRVGNITIDAGTIAVNDGALISASVFAGTATESGVVSIRARDAISIVGEGRVTGVFTFVLPGGQSTNNIFTRGDGSNIQIEANSFLLNNAQLSANNASFGNAGNIKLNVRGQLSLFRKALITSNIGSPLGSQAEGKVGSIAINTQNVLIDSSQIQAGLYKNARGGSGTVTIQAQESVIFDNQSLGSEVISGLFTNVEDGAIGDGSGINIFARSVVLNPGSVITASSAGQGRAGDILIQAQDSTVVDNSLIFSQLGETGVGQGGSLRVFTGSLSILNQGELSVSSLGVGPGGNMDIQANRIFLDSRGQILAETVSSQGGNITLQVRDLLLMRNQSLISATAGTLQGNGDGGNISITAPFVVGVLQENSDIRANAFAGRGGNVTINAQVLFGLQYQPQNTPNSDITASSQFGTSGVVTINTLGVDPSQGLVTLPTNLVDPSGQISQECAPRSTRAGKTRRFVVKGRGGVPVSPESVFAGDRPLVDLTSLTPTQPGTNTAFSIPLPRVKEQIVEAQAWVRGQDGSVYLVAQAAQPEAHPPGIVPLSCKNL